MKNTLAYTKACSQYGASMGRRNETDIDADLEVKLHLDRVPAVDGDYDPGGAYWGDLRGKPLYRAWFDGEPADGCVRLYIRASSRGRRERAGPVQARNGRCEVNRGRNVNP